MKWEEKGKKINVKYLNNLRFADDVMLIGKNDEEIQEMFQEFVECSNKIG